ncbi:hypothetical protein, partial [Aurantimonas sp. C2-4-R8]|nr:hypothetical protein [Aurantimonas sp. C2-4-R8]
DIFLHGVALLSGIGTPSLTAQGGQRRPLQSFNRDRDIPPKGVALNDVRTSKYVADKTFEPP